MSEQNDQRVKQQYQRSETKALELYLKPPPLGEQISSNNIFKEQYLKVYKKHKLSKILYVKPRDKEIIQETDEIEKEIAVKQVEVNIEHSTNNNSIIEQCCFPFSLSRRVQTVQKSVRINKKEENEIQSRIKQEQNNIVKYMEQRNNNDNNNNNNNNNGLMESEIQIMRQYEQNMLIEKYEDQEYFYKDSQEEYKAMYVKVDILAVDLKEINGSQINQSKFNQVILPKNIHMRNNKEKLLNFIVNNNDLCLGKIKNVEIQDMYLKENVQEDYEDIQKFEDLVNSKVNEKIAKEWINDFDEDIECSEINENSGLIHDMKYSKNNEIKPQMIVCVTVYNENADELVETLNGIAENAERFLDNGIDPRELAVIIIFDGIKAIHESCLDWLDKMIEVNSKEDNPVRRVIQKVFPKGRDVKDHVWPMNVSKETATVCQFKYNKQYISDPKQFIYLNTFFVAKHKNAQKLSSHIWFFQGFCKYFEPKYCVLLDCGTIPHEDALLNFYLTLESDKQVGGCCGYMSVSNATIFGIEGAQLFEYTFAHIFDKALEGLTGFIHVLPGAFSAYRWKAINDKEIFDNYFKTLRIQNPKIPKVKQFDPTRCCEYKFSKQIGDIEYEKEMEDAMTCQEKNMYLAEDRIFCLDIFCRAGKKYILKYVPEAQAVTDVMQSLIQLLNQRRRWINGSWFAFIYNWKNMDKVLYSDHSKFRIILFYLSMFYAGMFTVITYVLISLYYVVAKLILRGLLHNEDNTQDYNNLIYNLLKAGLLTLYFTLFIYSLHFKAQQAQSFFKFIAGLLALFNIMTFVLLVYFLISVCTQLVTRLDTLFDEGQTSHEYYQLITVSISLLTIVLHVVVVLITNTIVDLAKGLLSFIVFAPSYINTMLIYSFCNIDDITWGTRAGGGSKDDEKEAFRQYKLSYLIPWISTNLVLGEILSYFSENPAFKNWFFLGLATFIAVTSFIKIIGAILFYLKKGLVDNGKIKKKKEEIKDKNRNENIIFTYQKAIENYKKVLNQEKQLKQNQQEEQAQLQKQLKNGEQKNEEQKNEEQQNESIMINQLNQPLDINKLKLKKHKKLFQQQNFTKYQQQQEQEQQNNLPNFIRDSDIQAQTARPTQKQKKQQKNQQSSKNLDQQINRTFDVTSNCSSIKQIINPLQKDNDLRSDNKIYIINQSKK